MLLTGALIPFRYFGIYDQTDYNTIEQRNGQYVIEQLEQELSRKRAGVVDPGQLQEAGWKAHPWFLHQHFACRLYGSILF